MSLHKQTVRAMLASCAWLSTVASGCSFSAPKPYEPKEKQAHDAINASPLLPLAESSRYTVMETPGKMKLMHGYGCAYPEAAAGKHHVGFRVQESIDLPPGYTGTVFLNGFRGDYENGDRNMLGMGASLVHVKANVDKKELEWQASGVLGDNSGDDAYKWCYWYGIAMWNTAAPELDIAAYQTDADPHITTFIHHDDLDPGNDTALRELPGIYHDVERRVPKAVLPRGFGLLYADDDHNLLQASFDLGVPHTAGTSIEWTAKTVLKDNDDRRDYRGSALVSYLIGQSVNVWQPEKVLARDAADPNSDWKAEPGDDFELVPRGSGDWCGADNIDYKKREYLIENVPFDYALPMLAGWDTGNFCSDTNVEKIGVWITEVYFDKQPDGTNSLRYTVASMFTDDGGWNGSAGNATDHNVIILGFNEVVNDPKGSTSAGGVMAPLPTKAHE